ncbi:MAG: AmmeMemoRadiSam system protein B [Phycisphaerae bacterium]|nr:AmmeMemoRadiSam system protein B [Phycisphaerae bacterium]
MDTEESQRPAHIERPHLRRVLPQPVSNGEQQGLALRDPLMLAPQTMVIPIGMAQALQHFNGEWTVDEISTNLKAPLEAVEELVTKLDELGLLWGPTADELESAMRERLNAEGTLPMRQSRTLGEDAESCVKTLTGWMDACEDPEVEFDVAGIFSPRMDYQPVNEIYAGVYHTLRGEPIERVLVLGNNQFGFGEGVVGTTLGVQSPLGRLEPDTAFIEALSARLGDSYLADALDHIADFGIEMQVPWIQHCIGSPRIIPVLIPDPLATPSSDEPLVTTSDFVAAVRAVIAESPGRTLIIGTGDLSHIGPQFGEPRPIDEQRQFEADRADRELLAAFTKGESEAFVSTVKWNNNANRWSGIGVMACLLDIIEPSVVELIDYYQHPLDEQGNAMVASAGLVLGA